MVPFKTYFRKKIKPILGISYSVLSAGDTVGNKLDTAPVRTAFSVRGEEEGEKTEQAALGIWEMFRKA